MSVAEYPQLTRLFGMELEFFLMDRNGKISNQADMIINNLKKRLHESSICKESGNSMFELQSFPHRSSREGFSQFFKDFETLLYELEVNDLGLYNFGTYPGINTTTQKQDVRYTSKAKILGEKQWSIAQKCIGFHYHWSLPRNSFNKNIMFFYPDINKRKQDKILNLYNLYIALDPAITTFMQSSPYYEGKYLGKDSRIMVYRGDPSFNVDNQLYMNLPEFGILNNYAPDFSSLLNSINDKARKWKELLNKNGLGYSDFTKKDYSVSLLDSSWKPVKISAHETIESRGSDMNSLNKVVAMSSIMKVLSKYVQNKSINIVSSLIGNKEAFKIEGENLYVPTRDYLLDLQYHSALTGFESKKVVRYCTSLLKLIKKITPIESRAPIRTFSKTLNERKTTSDEIIDFVKKKQGSTKNIDEITAQDFAVISMEKIYKDLLITKKMSDVVF